jgi:predicted enzyme related to lactoylglutathione lyase
MAANPIVWFEIYVQDMARARAFYEAVLGIQLTPLDRPGGGDVAFPSQMEQYGASGALVKMPGFPSGGNSVLVYFASEDCATRRRGWRRPAAPCRRRSFPSGSTASSRWPIDTEGNMFGLHSMA